MGNDAPESLMQLIWKALLWMMKPFLEGIVCFLSRLMCDSYFYSLNAKFCQVYFLWMNAWFHPSEGQRCKKLDSKATSCVGGMNQPPCSVLKSTDFECARNVFKAVYSDKVGEKLRKHWVCKNKLLKVFFSKIC